MARLPLLLYPNARLREVSEPVDPDMARSEAFQSFLKDLGETLTWYRGVGISAIQTGNADRVFSMRTKTGGVQHFVNPEIDSYDGDYVALDEGCLSIPGWTQQVLRRTGVIVSALDIESGERKLWDLDGIEAQCAQHEMDHLDGKMFSDGWGPVKKDIVRRKIKKALRHNPLFKPME
jgi:peptide deformylase